MTVKRTFCLPAFFNLVVVAYCRRIWKRFLRRKRLPLRISRHLPAEKILSTGLYLLLAMLLLRLLFSVWQYINLVPDEGYPPLPDPSERSHFQDYQPESWLDVSQQHWFGVPGWKEVPTVTLPEVPFRATLRGMSWGTRAAAVIEEEGRQQMYTEGDVLTGSGAKVIHIYPDQIQVFYAGKIHCLVFDDTPADKREPVCPAP